MPVWIAILCLILAGCAHEEPLPPVPPMPEDLSTWSPLTPLETPPAPAPPTIRPAGPNERLYAYEPGLSYEVPVAMGYPTTIALDEGETVTALVGGDRTPLAEGEHPRWEVKEARSHVFITATEPGYVQGLTVATPKRVYLLTLRSVGKSPVRVVRWRYPQEPLPVAPPLVPVVGRFHTGYAITTTGPAPDWLPQTVVSDGKRTYIQFSPVVLASEMPLVRMIGPQGPAVLNARLIGRVLVIDQLVGRLELRLGTKEEAVVMTITRGALRTVTCPGDSACLEGA